MRDLDDSIAWTEGGNNALHDRVFAKEANTTAGFHSESRSQRAAVGFQKPLRDERPSPAGPLLLCAIDESRRASSRSEGASAWALSLAGRKAGAGVPAVATD
jgi:hypothetical protein